MAWWKNPDDRSTAAAALIGVLVGSAITGIISIVVTDRTIDANSRQQAIAIKDSHGKEEREKRATIYSGLLGAAEKWVQTRNTGARCELSQYHDYECPSHEQIYTVNKAFRDAAFNVYVYGSSDAFAAANGIGLAIPGTWSGDPQTRVSVIATTPFDSKAFGDAYAKFSRQMCLELQPEPSNCR